MIKPNSQYWTGLRDKNKKLGEGSSLNDKIMMFDLVEDAYGGDKGYLRNIMEQQLRNDRGTKDLDKLREFRRKRKIADEQRWRKMY